MMNNLSNFFSTRGVLIFISTTFSLLVVLLAINIITVNDLAKVMGLSSDATNALQQVVSRLQEVTHNIFDILSQMTKKILNSAGIDNGYTPTQPDPASISAPKP